MGTDTSSTDRTEDPGDLGRRLQERRGELGLSRVEVAQRAGTDPAYLRYIEERAATAAISSSTLYRLAAALETTAAKLQGEGFGQPVGSGPVMHGSPRLEVLDRQSCMSLLRPGGIGRLVLDDEQGPVALPLNFKMLSDDPVFHTGEGSIAAAVTSGLAASLEVDHFDTSLAEGWSVLVRGHAQAISEPEEVRQVAELGIESWAGAPRLVTARVTAEEVTGRRIRREL
ncbi:MAG: helix-turn-helix domain-containing protein [Acidimicrobiales bacterium]